MPLIVDSINETLRRLIKDKFEPRLKTALENCRNQLAAGGPAATAALQCWFGDNTADFRKEVKEKIAKMKMHLNATNIPCQMGLSLAANNNAEATHVTTGLLQTGGMSTYQAVSITQAHGRV